MLLRSAAANGNLASKPAKGSYFGASMAADLVSLWVPLAAGQHAGMGGEDWGASHIPQHQTILEHV